MTMTKMSRPAIGGDAAADAAGTRIVSPCVLMMTMLIRKKARSPR
jgi:hypothetical protein